MSKKILIITDFDLDGMGCALILKKFHKQDIVTTLVTTVAKFRNDYLNWAQNNNLRNYDIVYISDLDIHEHVDLIDHSNVVLYDHHKTHVENLDLYKQANTSNVKLFSSGTKLIYSILKEQLPEICTQSFKAMVALIDDYDSYKLSFPQSYQLNCLFSNTYFSNQTDRTEYFIQRFWNGFNGFDEKENKLIQSYILKKNNTINNLVIYEGEIPIGQTTYKFGGAIESKFINEICDHLIDQGYEIVFCVNAKTQKVSFRKDKSVKLDLSKLASLLCEGGGHEYAAGGKITEKFTAFVNKLNAKK